MSNFIKRVTLSEQRKQAKKPWKIADVIAFYGKKQKGGETNATK
jgi:hypothetical protein